VNATGAGATDTGIQLTNTKANEVISLGTFLDTTSGAQTLKADTAATTIIGYQFAAGRAGCCGLKQPLHKTMGRGSLSAYLVVKNVLFHVPHQLSANRRRPVTSTPHIGFRKRTSVGRRILRNYREFFDIRRWTAHQTSHTLVANPAKP
jgi:hypothetical protein